MVSPKGLVEAVANAGAVDCAGVPSEDDVAVGVADQRIQVTVAVDVGQVGCRGGPDVRQAEGVGGLRSEGRSAGRTGVATEERIAVLVAGERVEVAVAVDVDEVGCGVAPDVGQSEGVDQGRLELRLDDRSDAARDIGAEQCRSRCEHARGVAPAPPQPLRRGSFDDAKAFQLGVVLGDQLPRQRGSLREAQRSRFDRETVPHPSPNHSEPRP